MFFLPIFRLTTKHEQRRYNLHNNSHTSHTNRLRIQRSEKHQIEINMLEHNWLPDRVHSLPNGHAAFPIRRFSQLRPYKSDSSEVNLNS